jgi:epoxyqueuosine reductase QueG
MLLNEIIEEFAREQGADFLGIADLSPARNFILEQGGEEIAQYPRAISIGIVLLNSIVDQLPHSFEPSVAVNYRHHAYDVINLRLDFISSRLSSLLQKNGYQALPIPASERYDDDRICAVFSHKLAAHLAGLGWIGKSCLLVTEEAGPRVRWATVLTDAPLKAADEPRKDRCGSCTECVDICPVSAFTGRSFREDEPREVRYDARKCEQYFEDMEKSDMIPVCGLCLYACPYGIKKKYI